MEFRKLNCQRFMDYPEVFTKRFGRNFKTWSIVEIHDLYLRAFDRHCKRQKLVLDCIKRIEKEVPEFERGKRTIYYGTEDGICKREFSWNSEYDSWGIRCGETVKFKGNGSLSDRNEKLEFILTNEKAFELGELYRSLEGQTKHLHFRIKALLSGAIEEELRKVFKGKVAPETLTIKIKDHRYYVKCDSQFRHLKDWKKFELLNEVVEEVEL